jgi:hypothetical protein
MLVLPPISDTEQGIAVDNGTTTRVPFLKVFGTMVPALPLLSFRLGRVFLRFKRQSKIAGKLFQRELRKQGLDKDTAEALTNKYLEASHLRAYIGQLF